MAKNKQPKSSLFSWVVFISLMTASSLFWYIGYQYRLFALPVFVVIAYGAALWITGCVMTGDWSIDGYSESKSDFNFNDEDPIYQLKDGKLIDVTTGNLV